MEKSAGNKIHFIRIFFVFLSVFCKFCVYLIIEIIARDGIRIHKIGASLTSTGTAFWIIGVMFRPPVVT